MAHDQDKPPASSPGTSPEDAQLDGKTSQTGQIPLLDDVVYNTQLPFPKPRPSVKKRSAAEAAFEENAPRATDLFGGSAETAQSGPLSRDYQAEDIDAQTRAVRDRTSRVVDTLVAEYSVEIIERLRDELSAVLDDLKQDPSKSG
jgi:hypothetical protein